MTAPAHAAPPAHQPSSKPAGGPAGGPAGPPAGPSSDAGMRLLLLATMAVWGGNLTAVKLLMERLDPMWVSVLRMTVATVALWVVLGMRRMPLPRASLRQAGLFLACALLMVYLNQLSFMWGVQRTTAANAALIISLNPLVSALTAAALLGDRLTVAKVLGVLLGFGGVAAVVLHRPGAALGSGSLGDLLVFGSVVSWVGGGVLVQRLSRQFDSGVVSAVVFVIGLAMLLLHVALDGSLALPSLAVFTPGTVLLLVLSGLLASALGSLVWNRALTTLGVARTALYAYWVPIFGVGFAVAVLGEPLTVWHGVGLAGVLSGTWLGTRAR